MRHYLVVANQTLKQPDLAERIEACLGFGPCDFYLLVPATRAHGPVRWTPADARAVAGRRLESALRRFRALAVTFVYTRCPLADFCPLMDKRFSELEKGIAADPRLRDRVHLVSVSFDPAHDTPDVIATHAKNAGADPRTWSYLTGTPAAIDHVTSRFGVSTIVETDAPTITHNLRTALVDPKGRLVTIHSGNDWTVDALLADLRDASGR